MSYLILKQYAEDLNLTLKQVAERLNTTSSYLSQIMNGHAIPGPKFRNKFHSLLSSYKPYKNQQKQTNNYTKRPVDYLPKKSVSFEIID